MQKRRTLFIILLLCLLGHGVRAESTMPTPAEVCHVVDSLHTKHQARHTLLSAILDQDGFLTECVFPDTQPDILMGCAEFYLPVKTTLPSLAPDVNLLFSRALESAMLLTETMEGASLMNLQLYEAQANQSIGVVVPPETWWREGRNDVFTMFTSPILLINEQGDVIDDAVYMLTVYFTEQLTGIWVCADQDICAEMLYALTPPQEDGDESTRYLRSWLAGQGLLEATDDATQPPTITRVVPDATATPAPTASPARAYRILGDVKVTYHSRVNIRKSDNTDSTIIGHAFANDTFSVVEVMPSGWYKILFASEIGYIAPGIVHYTPY